MVLLFGITQLLISRYRASSSLKNLAATTLTMKLTGDINSCWNYVATYYGGFTLSNGKLADEKNVPIDNRFDLVDRIKKDLGDVATIFVKDGDDFTRVVTNVFNDRNERAIGTKLGQKSAAYEPVLRKERYIGSAQILGKPYFTAYDPIIDKSGNLIGILFIGISKSDVDKLISSELGKSSLTTIAITLFALFFFGGILLVLIGRLLSPVNNITSLLNVMSGGDLSQRIIVKTHDEIGTMSESFNAFAGKLQDTIRQFSDNTDTIANSASNLSATSTQIAANANNMASKTTSVVKITDEATTNMSSISAASETMLTSATSVATAIEEMSASLNEVAKNCQNELRIAVNASTQAKEGQEIMQKLGDAAQAIGKVIVLINNIADQTNLLALNATIEAASAGDAGKGFAVVANEVKELARQTAQATGQITLEIEGIQENSASALKAIELISSVIDEVNSISQTIVSAVEEQNATVNEIARSINYVTDGSRDVASNVAQSTSGLSNVAVALTSVNSAVADTAQGIALVKTNASELSQLSHSLKQLVKQFKV